MMDFDSLKRMVSRRKGAHEAISLQLGNQNLWWSCQVVTGREWQAVASWLRLAATAPKLAARGRLGFRI